MNLALEKDASSEVWPSDINDKMVGQRKLLTLLPIKTKNLHMAKGYLTVPLPLFNMLLSDLFLCDLIQH